jgi:long-chain acyl-CoA synthetase
VANGVSNFKDTFPKLLILNAAERGERPAIREKDLGIWQTWTWEQVLDEVRCFALGLRELGLQKGDTVAVIGNNRPRLYWSMCAAQSLGAIPVPVYQDSVAEETAFVLEHAGAKIAVVENQEQVDKLLSIADRLPSLTHIIYDETRGLQSYDHARLRSFANVQQAGREGDLVAGSCRGDPRLGHCGNSVHIGHHRESERRDADVR